jgi:hypothetical protein
MFVRQFMGAVNKPSMRNTCSFLFSFLVLFLSVGQGACQFAKKGHDFDNEAKRFFYENDRNFSLAPMGEQEICVFRGAVRESLTELNDWKKWIIKDTLEVKTYFEPYLQLHF